MRRLLILTIVCVTAGCILLGVPGVARLPSPAWAGAKAKNLNVKLVTQKVRRENLQPAIVARVLLESADNAGVFCRVKAPKGGMFSTTIKKLHVEDGDTVKKGQLLVELDPFFLEERYQKASIAADRAKLVWQKAESLAQIADAEAARAKSSPRQASRRAQFRATKLRKDLAAKRILFEHAKARCAELQGEIGKCKIYAPRDGIVVYECPTEARWGSGGGPSIVAEGETVREGQLLMRIPDLTRWQVTIEVPKKLVNRIVSPPQVARIRIEALHLEVSGQVARVNQAVTRGPDRRQNVKIHQAVIALYGIKGGFPGFSAEVSLPYGKPLENVLTVPVSALGGLPPRGGKASCLVRTANGPKIRDVLVGSRNEQMVEIKGGLREGELVIVNPHVLLNQFKYDKRKTDA
jgi:RND family efflux transporter MFP subunit